MLDFRKIKLKEREEANALFKSKKGKELQKEIAKKAKTFVPGGNLPDTTKASGKIGTIIDYCDTSCYSNNVHFLY